MRRVVAIGVGLALAASLAPVASARDLAGIRREQQAVRERLEKLEGAAGDLLTALQQLELQVSVEQAALAAAQKEVSDTEKALAFVERDLTATGKALVARRERLEPRLVVRYKLGEHGFLPLLLSAGGVRDFLTRRRLLARVVEADLEAMEEIRRLGALLAEQRDRLARGRADLDALRASAAARLEKLQLARADRETALAAVREEQALRQRAYDQLEHARRGLVNRLRKIERQEPAPGATGFAALRGRLAMPAPGAVEVGFGRRADPRYDTVTVQKGVDIRAPKGAKVKAVAPGRVVHAAWMKGYGNLVILDHGDAYYTLMAHLDRMDVVQGQAVPAGALVGLVGDTGSLKGAYLYFEIREGGRAVDPEPWFAR